MEELGPVALRRTSSSQSATWIESTIHSNISVNHDVNASALSVDATGSVGVLAARKGLYVIDLESPYQPARTLHHQTKWDVTVVKCNPHVLYKGLVASTSNHNTLLWNIDHNVSTHIGVLSSHQPLMSTLRAHTRPVSDVAWSPSEPTILATCSADTKTHLWDIRTPQKPAQSLCAFTTSANQVEWNRLDSFSLATAHDGEVRIWDTRSCEKPTGIITAHMQKIYGIDWSPTNMYELVTCSEDKTVKFWNVMRPRNCQGSVATGAPVWRARYTPFGDGLVTTFHRQDNTIRLWSITRDASIEPKPVYDFAGHTDLVKGFAWRQGINQTFQLISWSKNQELKMWRVEHSHLEACGLSHSKGLPPLGISEDYDFIDDETILEVDNQNHSVNQPPTSSQSATQRSSSVFKFDLASLKLDFVPLPLPSSTIYHSTMTHRDLEWAVEEWNAVPDAFGSSGSGGAAGNLSSSSANGTMDELQLTAQVREPIRRVSGGCFSGPNCLVAFDSRVAIGKSKVLHSRQLNPEELTWTDDNLNVDGELVEDVSAHGTHNYLLLQQLGDPNKPTVSTTKPYMENPHALNLRVNVLDCSLLCGQSNQLPTVTTNLETQAKLAASAGEMELSQMWSILAISADPTLNEMEDGSSPWSAHPFGANLVQHVLELYETAGDVSTLAAIACALDDQPTKLLRDTPQDCQRYDGYKQAQGELLYRQGAMNPRCEILKHLHASPEPHEGLTLSLYCHACGRPCSELYCGYCKDFSIKCSVCELVVRGQSMFCMNCGHGGHTNHVVEWFSTENACPTGCGCWCKQAPGPMEFQIPATPTHLARSYSF